MSRRSPLVPSRPHLTPFLIAAFPLVWFVLREGGGSTPPAGPAVVGRLGPPLVGALLASYLGSVAAVALLGARRDSDRHATSPHVPFPVPDDRALAVLAVLLVGTVAYLFGRLLVPVPPVVDAALTPLGALLGLPLLVGWVGLVAVGSVLGEPSTTIQLAVVALALAANAAWFVLMAGWVGRLVERLFRRG